ncbi:MAG: hypothetical protein KJP16_01015 [Gammaproteobacteria bacterium]|nr:hypothetical protein [Gammaproteobacteria bacterium]NNC56571.1 hypothetical protein [Woeseiaceae bacterium]NNL49365.1 hypothetical protein [Woeseiaceae bacterium]
MTRVLIVMSLLLLSTSVIADANDGEYLGFKLGDTYSLPRDSVGRPHYIGALTYVVEAETRHQHLDSLSVNVSPQSSTIGGIFGEWYFPTERIAKSFADGYLQGLEQKYGDWRRRRSSLTNGHYQFWVDLEQRPPIVDHWPSSKPFRVSTALLFAPDSAAQRAWIAKINAEADGRRLSARK